MHTDEQITQATAKIQKEEPQKEIYAAESLKSQSPNTAKAQDGQAEGKTESVP
jgi:hypothetical protein